MNVLPAHITQYMSPTVSAWHRHSENICKYSVKSPQKKILRLKIQKLDNDNSDKLSYLNKISNLCDLWPRKNNIVFLRPNKHHLRFACHINQL